jgi:hypothetical protein
MQENRHNRRLSCKIDYSLRSNRPDQSIASEFFTDDYRVAVITDQIIDFDVVRAGPLLEKPAMACERLGGGPDHVSV